MEREQCAATVQEGWEEGRQRETPWGTVIEKIKSCKRNLLRWKKRVFKRVDMELAQLKTKLKNLQKKPDINWDEIKATQKRIADLWRQEELYWRQRSRLKWLNDGDRNTKFFHATTLQRRDRNRITKIKTTREAGWREKRRSSTRFFSIFQMYMQLARLRIWQHAFSRFQGWSRMK